MLWVLQVAVPLLQVAVPLRVLWCCCDRSYRDAVAAEYPLSTLEGTCSSHSGTAFFETHVAGQEESGCVGLMWPHTIA